MSELAGRMAEKEALPYGLMGIVFYFVLLLFGIVFMLRSTDLSAKRT